MDLLFDLLNEYFPAIMRTFSMMQEDMSPYMEHLLSQLIEKLAAASKVLLINFSCFQAELLMMYYFYFLCSV